MSFYQDRLVSPSSHVASFGILVSMSTLQIGQRLLVLSHWSTHSTWNRCMHGSRLQEGNQGNNHKLDPQSVYPLPHHLKLKVMKKKKQEHQIIVNEGATPKVGLVRMFLLNWIKYSTMCTWTVPLDHGNVKSTNASIHPCRVAPLLRVERSGSPVDCRDYGDILLGLQCARFLSHSLNC